MSLTGRENYPGVCSTCFQNCEKFCKTHAVLESTIPEKTLKHRIPERPDVFKTGSPKLRATTKSTTHQRTLPLRTPWKTYPDTPWPGPIHQSLLLLLLLIIIIITIITIIIITITIITTITIIADTGAGLRNFRSWSSSFLLVRHRLDGYLASWVPSPPGKHTFKNFAVQTHPEAACKRKTRYPLG